MPTVDTRDGAYIRCVPERRAEIAAVAAQLAGDLGAERLDVGRLNPASGSTAVLRSDLLSPHPDPAMAAVAYLERAHPALGSQAGEVVTFTADPAVQRTSTGHAVVHLHQVVDGVPVFQMTRPVVISPGDRITRVTGDHAPIAAGTDLRPTIAAHDAVGAAAAFIAGHGSGGSTTSPTVLARFPVPAAPTLLEAEPFLGPIPAHL